MDMCKTEENKGRCKKSVWESQHYTSTLVFYSLRIEKRKNGQAEWQVQSCLFALCLLFIIV